MRDIVISITENKTTINSNKNCKKVTKGAWWMPRLLEAMKDVLSCDKLRGGANNPLIRRFPNGETQ